MESITSLLSLVLILGRWFVSIAVFLAVGWFAGSRFLDYRKERWGAWRKLAEKNNLTFVPNTLFTNAEVTGNYRDYDFLLRTCKRNYGNGRRTYTRMVLFRRSRLTHNFPQTVEVSLTSKLSTVDEVFNLLEPTQLDIGLWERVIASSWGQEISYEKPGIGTSFDQLQYLLGWLNSIAENYLGIINLGGVVVPVLQTLIHRDSRLKPLSTQLLKDIAQETTNRLGKQAPKLRCVNCLTYCKAHQAQLNWHKSLTYYGCRICGQSQRFHTQSTVTAILDNQTNIELKELSSGLQVNWLVRQKLFDFDCVEVVRATDEDVERFAVQVGNDTDDVRESKYAQMNCKVHPDCSLTENTLRILKQTFGRVEIKKTEVC